MLPWCVPLTCTNSSATKPLLRPIATQNIGDNVEEELAGNDLDSHTLPWQSDSLWIRWPARIIRWIWLITITHPLQTLLFLVILGIAAALIDYTWAKLSQGHLPVLLLMFGPLIVIFWSVYLKANASSNRTREAEDQ